MTQSDGQKTYPFDRPGKYRIRVQGFLDERWSERLAGMRISTESRVDQGQVTTLIGKVRDQAELAGVLNALYDLHLPVLLVEYQGK